MNLLSIIFDVMSLEDGNFIYYEAIIKILMNKILSDQNQGVAKEGPQHGGSLQRICFVWTWPHRD